jgi:tetratricopeptide (TPR) repeat protein
MSLGDLERAVADCNEATELNPSLSQAYFHRAHIFKALGKIDEAIDDFNTYIRLSKDQELIEKAKQEIQELTVEGK